MYLDESCFRNRTEYVLFLREIAAAHERLAIWFLVLLFVSPTILGASILGSVLIVPLLPLMKLLRFGKFAVLGLATLMLVPVANVIVLGSINVQASNTLRRGGVRVGLLSADKTDLGRLQ